MSVVVDTLATLKAITGVNKFNGLALIVMAKKAWYVCDIASIESADDDDIILPDDGIGRWYKCNNDSNILNAANTQTTSTSTITVDFTNHEEIQLVFNQSAAVQFPVSLRNGYGYLILNRNGGNWNVISWDARTRFPSSSYNFSSSSINTAILNLVFFNNVIYVTKITEYT